MADAETVVDRAVRLGIPQIPMLNFDLLRILAGHPLLVGGFAEQQHCIRLYTAEELYASAHAQYPAFTMADAVRLSTPIGGS